MSLNAQVYKTINVSTAGTLSTLLTASEKSTVTNLTLTGQIDSRDITCIRLEIKVLRDLDISAVSIKAYGTDLANELPYNSFNSKTLFSVKLPNSLQSIGDRAFADCKGLTSITIPSFVTSIGVSAFQYSTLRTVIMSNSVTKIGRSAFYHCSSLQEITLSNSLTTIGNSAFYECTSLTSVSIPSSVTSIEIHAFTKCSAEIIVEEGNLKYSSLDGVLFNKNQTKLIKCPTSKVGSYIIPNTVDSIEVNAFFHCSLLTTIRNESSLTTIEGGAFGSCTNLTSVYLPNTVTTIGSNCFEFCSSLTTITIPSSITSLASRLFYNCSKLTSITIPNLVTSIGTLAFYGCSDLKSIYLYNPIPPTTGSLSNIASTCTLYIPVGSKVLYINASGWKDFLNIVELTTNLKSISQSNIKMRIENKNLIIENATIDSKIEIYTYSGVKIIEKIVESNRLIIELEKGIYLIRIESYSDKIIIR